MDHVSRYTRNSFFLWYQNKKVVPVAGAPRSLDVDTKGFFESARIEVSYHCPSIVELDVVAFVEFVPRGVHGAKA